MKFYDALFWARRGFRLSVHGGSYVWPLSTRGVSFVRCPEVRGCPYLGGIEVGQVCPFYGGCLLGVSGPLIGGSALSARAIYVRASMCT